MAKFISYEEKFRRKCDFIVEYEFIEDQEDYVTKLVQGMRSDFCYAEDFGKSNHMIWPEFEDSDGVVVSDTDAAISPNGRARMWVILDEERPKHLKKLTLDQEVYFVSGRHKIAKATVVSITS